jgi:hypothetical protein
MSKLVVAILLDAILAAMFTAVAPARAFPVEEVVAAPSSGRTEVIAFEPAVPKGAAREGSCWTSSIALPRAGAWRCMIGNGIEDPCFTTLDLSNALICGANPATTDPGFLLKLTKPLPAPDKFTPPTPSPWIVELAIGQGQVPGPYAMPPPKTYCSRMTGTMAVVDGQPVPFSCWEAHVESQPKLGDTQIGLLGDFKPGRVWTVTEVTFAIDPKPAPGQPPFKLTGKRTIALEKVWE